MYGLLTSEFQGKVGRKHIHTARHSLWQVPKQTSDWLQWNISGKRAREGEMMGLSSLLEAVFLLHRGSFEGGEKKNLKPFYRSIWVHGHGAVCLCLCVSVFVGETDSLCVPCVRVHADLCDLKAESSREGGTPVSVCQRGGAGRSECSVMFSLWLCAGYIWNLLSLCFGALAPAVDKVKSRITVCRNLCV